MFSADLGVALLVIRDLKPITQEEAPWSHSHRILATESHPQSTKVCLVGGCMLKIEEWQR